MTFFFKKILKQILPYGIVKSRERKLILKNQCIHFTGKYSSWSAAIEASEGYDAQNIIDKVKNATLQVIAGEAAYERDSYLFYKPDYHWPFLTSLLYVATQNKRKLNILDFGGALGSSYWQNKKILKENEVQCTWHIVEQEAFIKASRTLPHAEPLFFHHTLEEALATSDFHLIIFSSVLQYLADGVNLLKRTSDIPWLLIDRPPEFSDVSQDRIMIQSVSPEICASSYPIHIFPKNYWKNNCGPGKIIFEWTPATDGIYYTSKNERIQYTGFLLRRPYHE